MLIELHPSAALRPTIDAYWSQPALGFSAQRILPDGCADLVFDLARGEAFVVGTMTAPLDLDLENAPAMFGVRFRAGRAAVVLRERLDALTDRRVSFDTARPLAQRLSECSNDAARIALLERELRDATIDRRLDGAIALLNCGGRNVDDIARVVGISRQHLARLFREHVGISPKLFARIARFRRLLGIARRNGAAPEWASLAAELGYTDPSHLIADFHEFAGTSPVPFFLSMDDSAR